MVNKYKGVELCSLVIFTPTDIDILRVILNIVAVARPVFSSTKGSILI